MTEAPMALAAPKALDLAATPEEPQLPPGKLRWLAGDLRTGQIETELPMEQTSWSTAVDDAGAIEGSLFLLDPDVADLLPRVTAAPCTRFIGVEYIDPFGGRGIVQAGPVWKHTYDDNTGWLKIGAAGIWSYYDHRFVIPLLNVDHPAAAVFSQTGGMSDLARQLVELAHAYTGGSVPIVLPDVEGGDNTRTYKGAELLTVGDALRNLTDGDTAVEVHFQPRRNPLDETKLEWVLRTGTTTTPTLTQVGDDHVWDISVPRRSMTSLSVDIDGSAMASRQWCPGSGSDTLKVIGRADNLSLVDQGYPLLEAEVPGHENVEIEATADAYAGQAVTRSQAPVQRWDATVNRDDDPRLGTYLPGDWTRFRVHSHLYLGAGEYRTRIIGMSGDDSTNVKLQLAATIGGL